MPRPRTLQDGLVDTLRGWIVSGRFKPGDRLPPRSELESRFGASRVTIQRVFDCLAREGFIVAESGSGTLVAPRPPHLSHFGLLFAAGHSSGGGFVDAIRTVAERFDPAGHRRVHCYFGLAVGVENKPFQKLVADVASHRLAGLVYVYSPPEFCDPAFYKRCNLPSVALTNGTPPNGVPTVGFSPDTFLLRALDHAAALKRKRVAGVTAWLGTFSSESGRARLVAERGLETRPWWWQAPNHHDGPAIAACVRLLLQGPRPQRPDALVVGDDNLIRHVCDGVEAAGLRVPQDLALICHANFPRPTACRLPVTRIGFDATRLLHLAIDVVERQMAGKSVPARTHTAAVHAHEALPPPDAPASAATPIAAPRARRPRAHATTAT